MPDETALGSAWKGTKTLNPFSNGNKAENILSRKILVKWVGITQQVKLLKVLQGLLET